MKVRPITIVAALAILALGTAGVVAWRHQGGVGVVRQPEALPIALVGPTVAVPAAAEGLMQPAGPVTYVAASGLAPLDGTAHAWKVTGPAPSESDVARLGRAFGVEGTPQHQAANQGTGWTMGATSQEGPTLSVGVGPASSAWMWTVEAPGSVAQPGVVCAQPMIAPDHIGPGDSVVTSPCPTVPAPEGVPDKAAAEAKARSLLTAAGFDLTGWQITATVDTWSADVVAVPVLDGTPVEGWGLRVSFGGNGVVIGASGWFGTPTQADAYPLVGTKQAIVHLNKGDTFVGGIEPMVAKGASTAVSNAGSGGQAVGVTRPPGVPPANLTTTTSTTITSTSTSTTLTRTTTTTAFQCPASSSCTGTISPPGSIVGGTTPGSTVTPPGPPVTAPGPTVTFAPVVITIDRAELVLVATTGTDGSVWLVPAYRLSGTQGGSWTVLAIDPSFLAAAPSSTTIPMGKPSTAPTMAPGSVEPQPAPAPAPNVPAAGSATTASTTIPSGG